MRSLPILQRVSRRAHACWLDRVRLARAFHFLGMFLFRARVDDGSAFLLLVLISVPAMMLAPRSLSSSVFLEKGK